MLASVRDVTPALSVSDFARAVAERMDRGRTASTNTRVIAIDGCSGSGKTHLADRVALALGAECVHLDDFVPGWFGLAHSVELLVEWVLEPLATGRDAGWRRWDWERGEFGEWETLAVQIDGTVVVEGCGAGSPRARPWLSTLIWLYATADERARRLRDRHDWTVYEPWFEVWADQENVLRTNDDPAAVADVKVTIMEGRCDRTDTVSVAWRT
jgi:hypothetical protein